MFRVGIVGHRYFSNPETTLFVAEQCAAILERARQQHRDVVAVSAIAEGADTLFAEAAVKLKLPLEIVRPFETYADDFVSGPAKGRYLSLQESARKEVRLNYEARSDLAYKAAMDWVIQQSDLVISFGTANPRRAPAERVMR